MKTPEHAISNPRFKAVMRGFRDGVSRNPIDQKWLVECSESEGREYYVGYKDGQHASRVYSEEACRRMVLVNPAISAHAIQSDARAGMVPAGELQAVEKERDRYRAALEEIAACLPGFSDENCVKVARESLQPAQKDQQ